MVMANWYNDTSRPRYWGTDTSDIYNGEIIETTDTDSTDNTVYHQFIEGGC